MQYDAISMLINGVRVMPLVIVLIVGLSVSYRQRAERPTAFKLFAWGVLFEISSISLNMVSPLILGVDFFRSVTAFAIYQTMNSTLVALAWSMTLWGTLTTEVRSVVSTDSSD